MKTLFSWIYFVGNLPSSILMIKKYLDHLTSWHIVSYAKINK